MKGKGWYGGGTPKGQTDGLLKTLLTGSGTGPGVVTELGSVNRRPGSTCPTGTGVGPGKNRLTPSTSPSLFLDHSTVEVRSHTLFSLSCTYLSTSTGESRGTRFGRGGWCV